MNRTVVFLIFSTLAALSIVGVVLLLIIRPDATATFTAFVVQILALVSVAAGTFYGLGKANEKLETVTKQTNGTLSGLLQRNRELEAQNAALRATHPNPNLQGE